MTKGPRACMISHSKLMESVTFIADLRTFPSIEALTSGIAKGGDGTFLCFVETQGGHSIKFKIGMLIWTDF